MGPRRRGWGEALIFYLFIFLERKDERKREKVKEVEKIEEKKAREKTILFSTHIFRFFLFFVSPSVLRYRGRTIISSLDRGSDPSRTSTLVLERERERGRERESVRCRIEGSQLVFFRVPFLRFRRLSAD